MQDLPGVVITGAAGRMGQVLVRLVNETPELRLSAALVREGHALEGQVAGPGVTYTSDPVEAFAHARAVIDFTTPEATVGYAALAAQAHLVHVIGTTGLSATDLSQIEAASFHCTQVRSGNMSLGVNLLAKLTQMVAGALNTDFDIEIVEAHHNRKVDAPSGTALMLGQAAADGRGVQLDTVEDRGRDGITGARRKGDIGFAAIRGGDIIGEHDVVFAGQGERIVLRHVASDRSLFARGAIRAAIWGLGRKPGQYTMMDVLGL
jgi:4-hydroxy-tetrahydrodipicolinate reductase